MSAQQWPVDWVIGSNVPTTAWPGGYPIGYLVDDGEYLCGQCVNDHDNPAHHGGEPDGWRIDGYQVLEGGAADYDGGINCAHCARVLVDGDA